MIKRRYVIVRLIAFTLAALVTACGGGGDGGGSAGGSNTYTVGGTINGLTGTGLVLQNNGGDNNSPNAGATSFTFATAVASGGAYSVTVQTNPNAQSCMVANGSGTVGSANITNITINCVPKNELVSRNNDDTVLATAYESEAPVISSDGRYVAFVSSASLAPGATNGKRHVFVRDRQTNQTVLVSRASGASGAEGDGFSFNPAISSDGYYVAFESDSTNLVPGDTNVRRDIFLRDLQAQTTIRVSVGAGGIEADGGSANASISADGRYVAFWSYASNLTASGDYDQVFVRDLQAGTTTLVSSGLNGAHPNFGSDYPAISADGSRIAFWSYASNLVAGDGNGAWDIFLYDRNAATKISLVSIASDGTQRASGTESISRIVQPSISADGNVVAFSTTAANLVAGDTNGMQDVFVHKMDTGETIRASVGTGGVEADNNSPAGQGERIALSSDGTWVAFSTSASNIAAGGTNVLLHNISTGNNIAVTVSATETSGFGGPSISGDGRYITFTSTGHLDPRFTNSGIFVQDRTIP